MAININPGSPLRHVATYNTSGNWTAPAGTNLAFVSIHSATGGGAAGHSRPQRYGQQLAGAAGGTGIVSGAYVQVTPGSAHVVTIGAAGAGGAGGGSDVNNAGGANGGTTTFDGAFSVTGTGGANAWTTSGRYSINSNVGASANSAGTTSLTSLNPGNTTLIRTGTISNQATGASGGGAGGNATRYNNNAGGTGANGIVHIYL